MAHIRHDEHEHEHCDDCGHTAVRHEGHVDYLHDGCMHHLRGGHVEEHSVAVSRANPDTCTPSHACDAHDTGHVHGVGCGHEAVPHGDHTDYLVEGHLHHPHGNHCDDHGELDLA